MYIPTLVLERPTYRRELQDGCFRPITYLLAKLAEELTASAFLALVFVVPVYFAAGLKGSLGIVITIYFYSVFIGVLLGYAIAAKCSSLETANALLPTYVTVNLFFSGYLITHRDIPAGWRWYVQLDWMWFGWSALMKNQFSEFEDVNFSEGQSILSFFDMAAAPSIGASIGILTLFALAFFLIAWRALASEARA